jgi:hypothetical protein
MHDVILQSSWESLLVVVPFVGILVFGIFRFDEIAGSPHPAHSKKRSLCGRDEKGQMIFSDPDGRPWGAMRKPR